MLTSSQLSVLTSPNVGALSGEEAAVITPFREVSVNWPAFAQLHYALPCKFLFSAAIDMVAVNSFGLLSWNVVQFLLIRGHCDSARKFEKGIC